MRLGRWVGASMLLAGACAASCHTLTDSYAVAPPTCVMATTEDLLQGIVTEPAACAACLEDLCAPEVEACLATACADFFGCVCERPNPSGVKSCAHTWADGQGTSEPLERCTTSRCGLDCDAGTSWACLGDFVWDGCPPGATADVNFSYLSLSTGTPFVGATVDACARFDTACAEPVTMGVTDATGTVKLTLPLDCDDLFGVADAGFTGFLRLHGGGLPDLYMARNQPIVIDEMVSYRVPSAATLDTVVEQFGGVDEGRGTLVYQVSDCYRIPAPGVTVSASTSDGSTQTFYVDGPNLDTSLDATQSGGSGGFINLPAGPTELVARLEDGTEVARLTVMVHEGALTNAGLTPQG